MQVETPSWFLSSWRRQDSVDWNLVRGNVWQFWKSWLLYAFNTMFISQDVTYCLTEFGYSQGRTIFKSWGGRHQSDSSLLPLKARGPVVKSCIAFTFQRYRHSCPRYHYLGFQPCSSWLWKGETEKMILAESSRNWRQLKKSAHWISFIHRECLFLSFFKKDKMCWKALIKTRNFV